jgi:nucleotide-binding universal stress UspA family protein
MDTVRKILVPTDFSEGALHALHEAFDLARALDAEVTLVHAYQLPNYMLPDGSVVLTTAEAHASLVGAADEQLGHLVELGHAANVPISTITREGAAADVISYVAAEGGYDLVVMGTHGRTGFRRLLLGSIAEKVVRTCTRPVMTIRYPRPEHAAAHPTH